jgi:Pyruvate/2-oxoglutarate dehydrogenase complex, dihydrolipoamide acyltransferase (E2) component, and related enzymes
MEVAVVMPPMGDAPGDLVLSRWHKGPGDAVVKGEPLFEVATEKADVEVESLYSGTLTRLVVAEGESAAEGATIAYIQSDAG